MKQCRTCRFMGAAGTEFLWSTETDDYVDVPFHPCARIIHGNASRSDREVAEPSKELAIVTDGSGYAARLRVLPTFGCVLHEPVEALGCEPEASP